MIIIELPWFQNDTRPNARKHWTARSKAKNIDKELGYYTTLDIRSKTFNPLTSMLLFGNIPLEITFYPPSNRGYDLDNCLASCKAQIDGISSALGINDRAFRPIQLDFGEVIKNGKIVYKINESP